MMASVGLPMKGVEHLAAVHAVGAEAGVEQIAHVQDGVLDAVAAQRAVKEQDEKRGQNAQPTHPAELFAEHLVRAHSTMTGLAAQSQLAHHDDEAAQPGWVDQKERKPPHAILLGKPQMLPSRPPNRQ